MPLNGIDDYHCLHFRLEAELVGVKIENEITSCCAVHCGITHCGLCVLGIQHLIAKWAVSTLKHKSNPKHTIQDVFAREIKCANHTATVHVGSVGGHCQRVRLDWERSKARELSFTLERSLCLVVPAIA